MAILFLKNWGEKNRLKKIERYTFTFSEIGWRVQIPISCELLGSKAIKFYKRWGEKLMEQLSYPVLTRADSKIIFYARMERSNSMACSITPIASRSAADRHSRNQQCKEAALELFRTRMPRATIDNRTVTEQIGGRQFEDFQILIRVGEKTLLHIHRFSAEINDHCIEISLQYRNDQMGEDFIHALRNSKFIDS